MSTRRKFIKQLTSASLAVPLASYAATRNETIPVEKRELENIGTIRVAMIGFGIMGSRNAALIRKMNGAQVTAICDLYKGRLQRAREIHGPDLIYTQDYKELLERKDIDAVFVCTSDQWHDVISIDAMKKGKAVYCEKPLVHQISQGLSLIDVQKKTGAVLQVGSQRVSSIVYKKAKELYKAGEIGMLNCIEASFDRHTALGAWRYTMPTDASESTILWKKYFKGQPPPFDPKRFFWWRNYKEYGTGVAGDLFVHLLSGIHFITDSKGPKTIFATGGLSYWKDGRNVPDVMTAVMEYPATSEHPEFQVLLKVNQASGGEKVEGGKVKFYGTEGMIDFGWNNFTITRNKFNPAPGIGGWDALDTYPKEMQQQLLAEYDKKYPIRQAKELDPVKFSAPDGYDDRYDHFLNFFESVRNNKPVEEDAEFGFRAAAPCLACNESYFTGKVIRWDPEKMKIS